MNKRTRKYFIKYTLEFFVIVLGISVSFLVQNVRKEKELDLKRELIIRNLLIELESNQAYITKKKDDFFREFDYVNGLLNNSLTKKKIKEYPTNYSPLNPFFSVVSFRPSRSIYNSLVNDGSFNLIEPPTLKALIDDVYKLNYNSIINIIESEKKVAIEADRFFVNNHSEIYTKNFWFNFNDEKLINSVFEIMQNDNHFKALMVQKISYMEVKTSALDEYSKKRDALIKLLKE
jgi:hypothetical protein